ncbi:hypothetical protein MPUL_48760 [Mycolicibacterium pulveris]|uniref:Uncharacterized protein n=1 Tax=Mycolicibacterium pulveris TaxID=36813 RepID=A0A7I7UQM3_MYCPV|nr:hypothetical protein MPUL_48760 [Mycolicibacterium pulveris]
MFNCLYWSAFHGPDTRLSKQLSVTIGQLRRVAGKGYDARRQVWIWYVDSAPRTPPARLPCESKIRPPVRQRG